MSTKKTILTLTNHHDDSLTNNVEYGINIVL